ARRRKPPPLLLPPLRHPPRARPLARQSVNGQPRQLFLLRHLPPKLLQQKQNRAPLLRGILLRYILPPWSRQLLRFQLFRGANRSLPNRLRIQSPLPLLCRSFRHPRPPRTNRNPPLLRSRSLRRRAMPSSQRPRPPPLVSQAGKPFAPKNPRAAQPIRRLPKPQRAAPLPSELHPWVGRHWVGRPSATNHTPSSPRPPRSKQ